MKFSFKKLMLPVIVLAMAIFGLSLINPGKALAAEVQTAGKIVIYMFWGDGCPHCATAKPVFENWAKSNKAIELRFYEVWYVPENQQKFKAMATAFDFEPRAVPTIFIGDHYWVGWSDEIKKEIQDYINLCSKQGCPDAGAGVLFPAETATPAPRPTQAVNENPAVNPSNHKISVPLLGLIDLDKQSLLISTILIAIVDGVNPCSVWVLTMLLALVLHTGSRKKIIVIGLVFLTVTALVYALFIAGLFSFLSFINYVTWIQVVVALVALFFGLVNIKDYFWYKEGISFTIADDKKPGIFRSMRRVVDAGDSFWGLIGATIVLSGGVSLVEFSCTAGFPILWTNLLTANGVTILTFLVLLLVYMLIYQLDEMIIFFSAVFTLKASRLEEKQGRILKLIGGVLMLTLSVVMLVNPALMNTLSSSLVIFAIAFGVVLLVLLLHRKILPAFGIWIGSEATENNPRSVRSKRK
ncbi:MAG TPA: thioredoxin family protein [Anaerolineaceae bacterium]